MQSKYDFKSLNLEISDLTPTPYFLGNYVLGFKPLALTKLWPSKASFVMHYRNDLATSAIKPRSSALDQSKCNG